VALLPAGLLLATMWLSGQRRNSAGTVVFGLECPDAMVIAV
jgi:hypothetical protein